MSDRHEARLILAILGERWDEARALRARRAPDPGVLADLSRACDVHPQVHAAIERSGAVEVVGPEALERLRAMRAKVRSDNLLLLAMAERALDRLLAEGIVPVALKGFDTIHRFGIGFDERTLDDVDLLVPPEKLSRALATLEAAGWRLPPEPERTHWLRSSFEMPLESPGPVGVGFEIHWSLGQQRRYRVRTEEILERALPLQAAGRPIRRLEDHDAAAHLLLHHLQHYFDRRLKWTLDLRRLAREPGFDWRQVAARLDAWGGRAAAGMAIRHLEKLFPGTVPAEVRSLFPAALWRRALTLPLASSHPLDLFRRTRSRRVQLFLAAVLLERPSELPGYLLHRATRDRRPGSGPRL